MKKIMNEFKEFAMKGNVMDMAIGVIIGGAFGKIITSLVNDIVMPAVGVLTGRVNLASLMYAVDMIDREGEPIQIQYGLFLQNILDFFIVALSVFFVVKGLNTFKKKQEAAPPPEPPKTEVLLGEIRDLLKER